ncbi:unnamed protein product [Rhizophagus irregularis]|nr:unnamed protein product [Rhizophagus irregularis]
MSSKILNSKNRGKLFNVSERDKNLISGALSLIWVKTNHKVETCTFEGDVVTLSYNHKLRYFDIYESIDDIDSLLSDFTREELEDTKRKLNNVSNELEDYKNRIDLLSRENINLQNELQKYDQSICDTATSSTRDTVVSSDDERLEPADEITDHSTTSNTRYPATSESKFEDSIAIQELQLLETAAATKPGSAVKEKISTKENEKLNKSKKRKLECILITSGGEEEGNNRDDDNVEIININPKDQGLSPFQSLLLDKGKKLHESSAEDRIYQWQKQESQCEKFQLENYGVFLSQIPSLKKRRDISLNNYLKEILSLKISNIDLENLTFSQSNIPKFMYNNEESDDIEVLSFTKNTQNNESITKKHNTSNKKQKIKFKLHLGKDFNDIAHKYKEDEYIAL